MNKTWIVFLLTTTLAINQTFTIGSDSAVTREAEAQFVGSTGNTLYGFSSFVGGFTLQDAATTCTYDNFFPITGNVNMQGGTLYLAQDMKLANPYEMVSAGVIDGQGHAVHGALRSQDFSIPQFLYDPSGFSLVNTVNVVTQVNGLDWNYSGDYVMAVCNSNTAGYEAWLLYFDGATLTTTTMNDGGTTGEYGKNVLSCAWHPTLNYVAIGTLSGTGNEIFIYHKNPQGPYRLRYSFNLASNFNALAWHPSGDYLIVGTATDTRELITFPFNSTTGVLGTRVDTNIIVGTTRTVSNGALSFAPAGDFFSVGLTSGTGNDMWVYPFTGGAIGVGYGIELGTAANTVAWNPVYDSVIAVGLGGSTTTIRLYEHNAQTQTITQMSAITESKIVYNMEWDSTGKYLVVGLATGTADEWRMYYYDHEAKTLYLVFKDVSALQNIRMVSWRPQRDYVITGSSDFLVSLYKSNGPSGPLTLKNVTWHLLNNLTLHVPVRCFGECAFIGSGGALAFEDNACFVVSGGAQLSLEEVSLVGCSDHSLIMQSDQSQLVLKNVMIHLDNDVTITQGSMYFEGDVVFSGSNTFIYSSAQTSTIGANTLVYFGDQTTLKYAPATASSSLLYMEDQTSTLMLDNCSLVSTQTAMLLDRGHLIFDNNVTLSNNAIVPAQAITLGADLMVTMLNNATVDIHGIVKTV